MFSCCRLLELEYVEVVLEVDLRMFDGGDREYFVGTLYSDDLLTRLLAREVSLLSGKLSTVRLNMAYRREISKISSKINRIILYLRGNFLLLASMLEDK